MCVCVGVCECERKKEGGVFSDTILHTYLALEQCRKFFECFLNEPLPLQETHTFAFTHIFEKISKAATHRDFLSHGDKLLKLNTNQKELCVGFFFLGAT